MAFYEVLGRGHHVTEKDVQRMAATGEIVELTEQAAAPLVPWRLKRRRDLEYNATEAAVELAQEYGVDLATVKGTGKDGRITQPDVERAIGGNP